MTCKEQSVLSAARDYGVAQKRFEEVYLDRTPESVQLENIKDEAFDRLMKAIDQLVEGEK